MVAVTPECEAYLRERRARLSTIVIHQAATPLSARSHLRGPRSYKYRAPIFAGRGLCARATRHMPRPQTGTRAASAGKSSVFALIS